MIIGKESPYRGHGDSASRDGDILHAFRGKLLYMKHGYSGELAMLHVRPGYFYAQNTHWRMDYENLFRGWCIR